MEQYKFKALVGQKFGGVCYTIYPTFFEYSRIGQFINTNVPIEKRRQRKRAEKRERAVKEYTRVRQYPGWTPPVCEFMPGSILIEPTDDADVVFVTIFADKPVDILEGQTRFGGCVLAVNEATVTDDKIWLEKLKTQTNGVDLIPFVDCATSLERFADMGVTRPCDSGYLRLTSTDAKNLSMQYVYKKSRTVNSLNVAMSKDEFAANPSYMMSCNQLFKMLEPLMAVLEVMNTPVDERIRIIDDCFEALNLVEGFRLRAKTQDCRENATVLKNVVAAFARLIKDAPQSYQDKLDKMRQNADWRKKNVENIGGFMSADRKALTGWAEGQIELFTIYMLELPMTSEEKKKLRKTYLSLNVLVDEFGATSKYNTELPIPWTRRTQAGDVEQTGVATLGDTATM